MKLDKDNVKKLTVSGALITLLSGFISEGHYRARGSDDKLLQRVITLEVKETTNRELLREIRDDIKYLLKNLSRD